VLEMLDYLRETNIWSVMLRLTLAIFFGGLLGLDRSRKRRPAGFRTYMLVCLGAALTMLLSQYEYHMLTHAWAEIAREIGITTDVSRFGAQAINGIGFLGAGTILVTGHQEVRGMTTAASLWSVACLGIAAGGGYYMVALIGMVFIFITLTFFELIQNKLIKPKTIRDYTLEVTDVSAALETIGNLSDNLHSAVSGIRAEAKGEGYTITFRVQFPSGKKWPRKFFEGLAKDPAIRVAAIVEDTIAA